MKVQVHDGNPAINVKVYGLMSGYLDRIVRQFKCSEEDAQRALDFAFEDQQQSFWDEIESVAQRIFGNNVRTFSEGRSGGWLSVRGLENVTDWKRGMLYKWERLEKLVAEDIAERTSYDSLAEAIEANRWAEPMSEKYNFLTLKNGKTITVAKVNQMVAQYREDLLDHGGKVGR